MKTTISIPDPLFDAAEKLAKRLRISRSELYRQAIAAYLKEASHSAVTAKLDDVYGAEGQEARVDPVIDQLQHVALDGEDW